MAILERELASPMTQARPKEFHWTTERFYRAAEAGVFDDPGRLEIIHGRIIVKMPISPLHSSLTAYIADSLRAAMPLLFRVRAEGAIHIAFDGEPIPDVAVVRGTQLDYLEQHPTPEAVVLLVEIAVTSADYDLGEKALLYAQANISDYWVVLPGLAKIAVHREPTADGYQSVVYVGAGEFVSPLVAPETMFAVSDLLGQRGAEEKARETNV